MIVSKNVTLTGLISLILLIIFPGTSRGQENLRYSGPLEVGNYSGYADLGYILSKKDSILNGDFKMQSTNLDELLIQEQNYFSFDGAFKDNLADGLWNFSFGDFSPKAKVDLVGYEYQVKLNGKEHSATGQIIQGKPQGEWVHAVFQIQNSEKSAVSFKSTYVFEEGVPQKSFQLENQEIKLLGRFLRNGLAHDVWLIDFKASQTSEEWHFLDGRLEKIVIEGNATSETLEVFPEGMDNPETLNMDDRYFKVIEIKQSLSGTPFTVREDSIAALLIQNTKLYRNVGKVLAELSESEFNPQFKVKLNYFPLEKEEQEHLDSIATMLSLSQTITTALNESTQLNILKHADKDVLYLLSATEAIQEEFINPLQKITEYQDSEVLEYLPRENLSGSLKGNIPSTEIEVNYETSEGMETRTFEGPGADMVNIDSKGLASVQAWTFYAYNSLDSIRNVLDSKVRTQERQQELSVMEDSLMTHISYLELVLDSVRRNSPKEYNEVYHHIYSMVDQELGRYTRMDDVTLKTELLRQLIDCSDHLSLLAKSVSDLPGREEEISEVYSREVWNPFTSTIMNEDIKKRLVAAYSDVLVPYALKSIQTDLDCENVLEFTSILDSSYERMLQLVDENTSRLERKLKNEKDPQVVMQLLNISIQ